MWFLILVVLAGFKLLLADEPILLYPKLSVFQFTMGMSVPIAMDKKGGLAFSSGFQFNYAQAWNLTQFEPMVVYARSTRQTRHLDMADIYASLQELLERHGWKDGRSCLLRTICEVATNPILRSGDNFIEELVHLLLTPSEEPDYSDHRSGSNPYVEAERTGALGLDCVLAYPGCADSPLDSFTEIAFN